MNEGDRNTSAEREATFSHNIDASFGLLPEGESVTVTALIRIKIPGDRATLYHARIETLRKYLTQNLVGLLSDKFELLYESGELTVSGSAPTENSSHEQVSLTVDDLGGEAKLGPLRLPS